MDAQEFKDCLADRGLTVPQVAELLQITTRTVYRIQAGEYPCPPAARKLLRLMRNRKISVKSVEAL